MMTKKRLFIVDTLLTYRMRYVVEAESLEHAYDEVTMKDSGCDEDAFDELSQKPLQELIVDGRKISRKKLDKMFAKLDADGETMSYDVESAIRRVDYDR